MTAYKLCSRMHHNIRAVLYRAKQIRSRKGIINYKRDSVTVRNIRQRLNINNIRIRIAERFGIYKLRVRLYPIF